MSGAGAAVSGAVEELTVQAARSANNGLKSWRPGRNGATEDKLNDGLDRSGADAMHRVFAAP